MNAGKFSFVKIRRVIIRDFSLYSKDGVINQIDEQISDGVFCLAGANGLGKTTFLNILNYGLTGIVLEPDKGVASPSQIESSNKDYTERYFSGRVHSSYKSTAEVELFLAIGSLEIRIVRNFFNREELRLLDVYEREKGKSNITFDTERFTPYQLNSEYKKLVAEAVGIGGFEYFLFYQLYVLTFDENRRMIFWDTSASTSTLSLAFNNDLNDAEKVLSLKKEMDSLESYGRNTRWQATQLKNERENLVNTTEQRNLINYDEIKGEFDNLNKSIDKKNKIYSNVSIEYDTLLKRQNIINSELFQHKNSYNQLFNLYSEPRSKIIDNKYIKFSLDENKCLVCGSEGNHVHDNIQKKIHQLNCPLCNTNINDVADSSQGGLIQKLKELDTVINEKTTLLEKLTVEATSKQAELEKIEVDLEFIQNKLKEFEKANPNIHFEETGDVPIDKLLKEYEKRFLELDRKAKNFYKQRDKLRPEYDNLVEKISKAYDNAVKYFVPLFKEIAKSFIGFDLNIYFKREGRDITLKFELLGTARTESTQLSESQRFFLDIALRMALVIYLAKKNAPATLYIDTPEGSLDIAYESRVGKMFATFVKKYYQNIIMTANINASQLLLSLAEECGNDNMEFRRMLDWTDLSEIQKEGESLFEKVFINIEKALNKN